MESQGVAPSAVDDEGVEKGALRGKHKGGLKLTVA